ncbi:MAG: terpene cyclase/mutase family protein [Oscillospiraceae bacterium]|jgi:hypothetical protein|nr:terpene cyclase/mutase family protein [Oscillospiraceae bacterium]
MKKRILSLVLALFMLTAFAVPSLAAAVPDATTSTPEEPYYGTALAELLAQSVTIPADGTIDSETDWLIIALAPDGINNPLTMDVQSDYQGYIEKCINAAGDKITLNDTVRWLLALRAVHGSAEQTIAVKILLDSLEKWDFAAEVNTWGIAYALIVLDAYEIDNDELRGTLRGILAAAQHADGGYNYLLKIDPANEYSKDSDPDSTAAVLTALAPYKSNAEIAPVVQRGLAYLKSVQLQSGGYGMFGESADSAAQVIIALCALGIDPLGADAKNESDKTPVDSMQSFRLADHSVKGYDGKANAMSGYQVLLALKAMERYDDPRYSADQSGVFVSSGQNPASDAAVASWVLVLIIGGGIVVLAGIIVLAAVISRRKKHA